MKRSSKARVLYLLIFLLRSVDTSVLDWIWGGSQENASPRSEIGNVPIVKVPFEVATEDEKFLQEAKKYTSLQLSDLDACQHRVVMKIHNSCSDLTEEELAKLSVNLLNCQSAVEGRQHFPCTSSMSIRECTSSMDPVMWNTYHLMNNRARAVCYAARSQQFRALSEMMVNKLMDTAHSQLITMNSLKEGQQQLESLTAGTMESVSVGHQSLMDQQEKLRATQHSIQDFIAQNLLQLTREKMVIESGHRKLSKMMEYVRNKLDEANADLSAQTNERRENHKQLLQDLDIILDQVSLLWQRIDHSTQEILARHASATEQYNSTLNKLSQINATVSFLLDLLDKTRHELDERLGWLTDLMGGTGNQLGHLYSCVLHVLYLIVGMITAAFLRAPTLTRAFLLLLVPVNFAVTCNDGDSASLDFLSMTILITASIAVHYVIQTLLHYCAPRQHGPMYFLQNSQPQPMTNGFIAKPSSPLLPHKGIIERLRLFKADSCRSMKFLAGSWTAPVKLVLAAASHRGDTLRSDERDHIPAPMPEGHLDEGFSHRDFTEGLTNSSNHCNDSSHAATGVSSTLRQRFSTPIGSSFTPTHTLSRSGTPSYPDLPRSVCRAICRNGQQCRNSASQGSDVCRRHL